MKKLTLLLLLFALSCYDIIGSKDVIELDNVVLTVTEMEAKPFSWKVSGTILNNGETTISPPWYIEAMFYSDSTFTTTFGGDNDRMNFPLESGVTGYWVLTHRINDIVEADYPNFAFKDMRASIK